MDFMSEMKINFFTIADYQEEEIWLREQHKNGRKIQKIVLPCFYIFEECEPEDVIYRLDYKNSKADNTYIQMFQDYGWEYFADCAGWHYLRKPASEMELEEEKDIFSDNTSRLEMVQNVFRTRMVPLMIILLCCILPQLYRLDSHGMDGVLKVVFAFLLVIYLYLIAHCTFKLKKIRDELI